MEHLRYIVPDELHIKHEKRLMSYWLLASFFLLVSGCLVYLFPGQSLILTLTHQEYISEVDVGYSILLLNRDGGTPITFREIKRHPSVIIKQLEDDLIDPDLNHLWAQYIILKMIAYAPEVDKKLKRQANRVLLDYLKTFQKKQTTFNQDIVLVRDALAINNAGMALYFYERALAKNPEQDMYFYAHVGETALWAQQCIKSAHYYFIAQDKAATINDKRYFYILAVKILFECEKYDLALSAIDKHIDGLIDDELTYQLLTDMAIRANKPEKAQDFLLKLLQLKEK
ncbi:hypothetical protein [Legionella spiritensis]|uniref:hypothetical protein n=1 Tax=Legionella spiritensis TaxID=452 RepID=UPI000F6DABC8|nr:hypothetical protein [Legionella spiritensis]VEG90297.1 Uncharacterised protein [Legionella spiritensis]